MSDQKKRDSSEAPHKHKLEQAEHSEMSLAKAIVLVADRLRVRSPIVPPNEPCDLAEIRDVLAFLCTCMIASQADFTAGSPPIDNVVRVMNGMTDIQRRSLWTNPHDHALLEIFFVALATLSAEATFNSALSSDD